MHEARWLGVLVLALLLPAEGGAEEITREFSHRFEAGGARELMLRHGDGDVEVIPHESPTVTVEVVYRVEVKRMGWGTPPDLEVEFSDEDGILSVVGSEKGSVNVGVLIESHRDYRYTIHAPPDLALDTRGDDGEVQITGWRAPLTCELEDGEIRLADCGDGPVWIDISDGNVVIDGMTGKLVLAGEDGKVEVRDADLAFAQLTLEDGNFLLEGSIAELEAGIVDGSLFLDGVQLGNADLRAEDGRIRAVLLPGLPLDLLARCEDGRVELVLPPGLSAIYEIRSEGGMIDLELPGAEDARREKGGVTGKLGDGAGRIRITTGDGTVRLGMGQEQ
jgi:hypothetical protein